MAKARQLKYIVMAGTGEVDLPKSGEVAVTVRLGSKWQAAGTGEVVELWECEKGHGGDCPDMVDVPDEPDTGREACRLRGHAKVLGWWSGVFQKLPPQLLAIEHSYNARTLAGLAGEMAQAYGDSFTLDSQVTALIFQVL